jgi:hypothetical protein
VFSTSVASLAYTDAASKIALAVAVGLLVGLEREWAQKAVGVRTFAIIALLGALTYIVAPQLLIAALCGTFLLVILLNVHHLLKNWQLVTADLSAAPGKAARESAYVIDRDAPLEITTSVALLVTLMLGALIRQGHYFTAIASAIVMTMLLAWKEGLSRFASGCSPRKFAAPCCWGRDLRARRGRHRPAAAARDDCRGALRRLDASRSRRHSRLAALLARLDAARAQVRRIVRSIRRGRHSRAEILRHARLPSAQCRRRAGQQRKHDRHCVDF